MKKLIVFLLFSAVLIFSDQIAINNDGVKFILKDDGSWLVKDAAAEAEMHISPIAITKDSQLVLLKEETWEYISPDDTINTAYQTITVTVVPYYLLEKEPLPRVIPKPKYPISARAQYHEGQAVVKVLVDTEGDVIDLHILKSSGYMDLDQAAIKAAWKAKFSPAEYNGKPVRVWVAIPIKFRLTDE